MEQREMIAAAVIGGVALLLFSKDGPLSEGFSLGGDNPPATVLSGLVGPGGGSGGGSGGYPGGGPGEYTGEPITKKAAATSIYSGGSGLAWDQISPKIKDDMARQMSRETNIAPAPTVKQLVKTSSGYGYVNTPISPIMLNLAGNNPANVASLAQGILDMTPSTGKLDQLAATLSKKSQSSSSGFYLKPPPPPSDIMLNLAGSNPANVPSIYTAVQNLKSSSSGGSSGSSSSGSTTKKAASTSTSSAIKTIMSAPIGTNISAAIKATTKK